MNNFEITSQGYATFIPIVCDSSSIQSTMNSNHTLEQVSYFHNPRVPKTLYHILHMNTTTDKRAVAKLKVLRYHFNGNFNMKAVAGLDAKALPYLLSWFGRLMSSSKSANREDDRTCRSAFYRIIRHNPELCGYPSYERVARIKAEDQVALLGHKLNVAESRIEKLQLANEAMERELEELRRNKRQKGAAFLE